ncbi:MAG: hypothetical protein P8Z41_08415 [Anaerolineales bacterium]
MHRFISADWLRMRRFWLWFATGAVLLILAALAAVFGPIIHRWVSEDPISLVKLGEALLWIVRSWLTYAYKLKCSA